MTVKEYRANFKKKEKENKGLWTCIICEKTYAPMWFEEIKIGNSPIRYCRWCRQSIMTDIIKNKLEQLKESE